MDTICLLNLLGGIGKICSTTIRLLNNRLKFIIDNFNLIEFTL